jgi:hypothetical protein
MRLLENTDRLLGGCKVALMISAAAGTWGIQL